MDNTKLALIIYVIGWILLVIAEGSTFGWFIHIACDVLAFYVEVSNNSNATTL